jgi:hypothetical protein
MLKCRNLWLSESYRGRFISSCLWRMGALTCVSSTIRVRQKTWRRQREEIPLEYVQDNTPSVAGRDVSCAASTIPFSALRAPFSESPPVLKRDRSKHLVHPRTSENSLSGYAWLAHQSLMHLLPLWSSVIVSTYPIYGTICLVYVFSSYIMMLAVLYSFFLKIIFTASLIIYPFFVQLQLVLGPQ